MGSSDSVSPQTVNSRLLRRLEFDTAPLLLAFVLGPILEKSFRQSLLMGMGNPLIFVARPLSFGIFVFAC
jgi:putative tricarboxylic transport membrane protein